MRRVINTWLRRSPLLSILLALVLTACGASTPTVVQNDKTPPGVYVASIANGQAANTLTETVSALSPNNGEARWNSALETANLVGHWGTPLISDGMVYASSVHVIDQTHATGYLAAFSAQDGHTLWRRDIGVVASDPIIQGSIIFISAVTLPAPNDTTSQNTRSVFALNKQTGTILWRTTITGDITRLALIGSTLYSISSSLCFDYCSSGGLLAAINASSGALLWHQEIKEVYHLSLPQVVNGTLYFGTADYHANVGDTPSAAVLAVNSQDGSVRWTVPVYRGATDGPPLIANGRIFADLATIPNPYFPNKGTYALAALSLDNGKVVWQSPTDVDPSLPVLANGVLYLTSTVEPCNNASCYTYFAAAFNVADGKRLWRVQIDPLASAPVVANGKVYLLITHTQQGATASDSSFTLTALDAQSGAAAWQTPLQGETNVPPTASIAAITSDVIYVALGGAQQGPAMLISVNTQSGASQWTWQTAGFIGGLMVIQGGLNPLQQ